MRRSSALLVLALALTRPGAVSAREADVDPAVLAPAFNAAWNAHDVEGVVAFFAPGAAIRQTRALVADDADGAPDSPAVEDAYGAGRRSLAAAQTGQDAGGWARGEVLWAAGTRRIRAWLPALFASGHHVEASAYRVEGDTVTWRYRAYADPYQQLAGVEPAAGTARLLVDAGRIAAFVFDSDGESVARRQRQFAAAVNVRLAAAWAAAPGADPSSPPAPAAPAAAPDAPDLRLPLGLVGAAALASLVETRRHRGRTGRTG